MGLRTSAKKGLKKGLLVLGSTIAAGTCFTGGYDAPERYALMISGATEDRDIADLSLAYETLLEKGFKKENIYILDSDGVEAWDYPVFGTASKKDIIKAIGELEKKVTSNDLFFLFTTDHGNRVEKSLFGLIDYEISTFVLGGDEEISQLELAAELERVKPSLGIYLFDQCYSGGFAEQFGGKNIVAIASSKADELAWGDEGDTMGYHFLDAFMKYTADENEDGKVSIKEAFDYMLKNHTKTIGGDQTPFIKSDIDPDKIFLK